MILKHFRRQIDLWVPILAFVAVSMPVRALEVGRTLPEFSLRGLDSRLYAPSEFRGKVLVLYLMGYA